VLDPSAFARPNFKPNMAEDRKKVVWFEGMTLDPHHLQQWDRYQQSAVSARMRAITPYDWGFSEIEIDREALGNGEFVLLRAGGVMPDGLIFNIPDNDPKPPSRNIQTAFPATEERLPVFLCLPAERPSGSNVLLQGTRNGREMRYNAETIQVADDNTGTNERSIEVARTNFQLRVGGESLGDYSSLQVAEIRRSGSGAFVLSETFVPPCLNVGASERLMTVTRRLLELLVAKSTSLADRRSSIMAQRELSPADVAAMHLYSTVNTYIPLLNHHYTGGAGHPESLYTSLLLLAGQLSAGVAHPPVSARDLPVYNHGDLTAGFERLDGILREMIGGVSPEANYVQVPLNRQRENLFVAQLDANLLEDAQLFLVARSDKFKEDVLVAELPRMLRIASPQTIDAVLRSYTRALAIEHTTRLPSGMPVDARANYFQLQKRGPFWEAIQDSKAFALFVPSEFSDVNMTLIAVNNP
jgi:type VI secretion system protein ImpJ